MSARARARTRHALDPATPGMFADDIPFNREDPLRPQVFRLPLSGMIGDASTMTGQEAGPLFRLHRDANSTRPAALSIFIFQFWI